MPIPADDLPKNLVPAGDLPSNLVPENDLPSTIKTPRSMSMFEAFGEGRKGIMEGVASLASGAVAGPVSGLAGIAQQLFPSPDMSAGARVRQVQNALTYGPRTEVGRDITNAASYPFVKLSELADKAGGKVTDVTGSPALGTAANVTLQSAPLMLGR